LTGPAVRSDERSNGHYFGPGNSTRQAQSTDRINDRNTASPGRIITIPNPSGVPGSGTGVPDGGTTAMLLGTALGALGMARRYLRS
jgi:hypothetical protein